MDIFDRINDYWTNLTHDSPFRSKPRNSDLYSINLCILIEITMKNNVTIYKVSAIFAVFYNDVFSDYNEICKVFGKIQFLENERIVPRLQKLDGRGHCEYIIPGNKQTIHYLIWYNQ